MTISIGKSHRINFHTPPFQYHYLARIQSSGEQSSRNVDPISRRRSSRRFNLSHRFPLSRSAEVLARERSFVVSFSLDREILLGSWEGIRNSSSLCDRFPVKLSSQRAIENRERKQSGKEDPFDIRFVRPIYFSLQQFSNRRWENKIWKKKFSIADWVTESVDRRLLSGNKRANIEAKILSNLFSRVSRRFDLSLSCSFFL